MQNVCETNDSVSLENTVFACAIVCVSTHIYHVIITYPCNLREYIYIYAH